jgi:hypothetical protein
MNEPQAVPDGRWDVDLLLGRWRLHSRRLVDLLDGDCAEWVQFEAEGQAHPILGGPGNLDSFSARRPCRRPAVGGGHAASVRSRLRAGRIWWTVTSRGPGTWTHRCRAAWAGGYGRFQGDDVLDGQPIRVRFIWKDITATSARFKQAVSYTGACWQTNWVIILTQLGEEDDHG